MKKFTGPAWLAITTSVFAVGALSAGTAIAQEGADEAVEEIITLGTRRQGRTAVDTAVPVDVFSAEELDRVSSDDLIDVIKTLVPSFTVGREPISDGGSMISPPQMRGLDSDKTLVLINGKRRHRAALVQLGGFGSHGRSHDWLISRAGAQAPKKTAAARPAIAAERPTSSVECVERFRIAKSETAIIVTRTLIHAA